MAKLGLIVVGLMLALPAQAQFIDCSGGCSETLYGLGNDADEGPLTNSLTNSRTGPGDGSCGPERLSPFQGQLRLREQANCIVSGVTRCPIEIPRIATDSGYFGVTRVPLDLGPLGLVVIVAAQFLDVSGNIGHRQLSGTCTLDAGEECAVNTDCPSMAGCASTCFSSPATTCSSHADCPGADCRTEAEWDGIGLCTDDLTSCTSDGDCNGEDFCRTGFTFSGTPSSCFCCQSTTGVTCPILGAPEYPALFCGQAVQRQYPVGASDWLFEGGRGTRFEPETIQVPAQQEGVCNANRLRPCGTLGDFWAGAANAKCTSGTPGCVADPFGDDLALASTCDDVAFGGVGGDFCDLSEQGYRSVMGVNPDGSRDLTVCAASVIRLVGNPGELCALPVDIPEGDPQPGCRLINIGIAAQPDLDCSGVDDTTEGRCMPEGGAICSDPADCPPCADDGECASGNCINGGDLCAFIGEANWFLDTNNDDIGDECQCGDGNGDGAITGIDIGAVAVCANDPLSSPLCDATIIDATGDNATTAEDIGGVVAAVNGSIPTSALECVRNLGTP